jgi:hypothetical protein
LHFDTNFLMFHPKEMQSKKQKLESPDDDNEEEGVWSPESDPHKNVPKLPFSNDDEYFQNVVEFANELMRLEKDVKCALELVQNDRAEAENSFENGEAGSWLNDIKYTKLTEQHNFLESLHFKLLNQIFEHGLKIYNFFGKIELAKRNIFHVRAKFDLEYHEFKKSCESDEDVKDVQV